ncbi:MAG TPA: DUF4118 domain-containing protein [Candidatus Limnocylindrales bacterium]
MELRPPAFRVFVRRIATALGVAIPSLVAATTVIWVLERGLRVHNASVVYLAAVVATAIAAGTPGAILAAVASFLAYDFFFVEPYYTLTIADPSEWIGVGALLFTGVVVGELTALQRSRGELAEARAREARALFRVSRVLAVRPSTAVVLPALADVLRRETAMERVWVALGSDDASERVAADTAAGTTLPPLLLYAALQRTVGDEPAQWRRVHVPGPPSRRGRAASDEAYRVRITAGDNVLGSIWGLRRRGLDPLDPTQTRLLAAAADQLGQALAQDRLAGEAQEAQLARRSDELKTALLQSVSHDLRTPLATIRAAAGTLRDEEDMPIAERRAGADAIDREVEYLNRLVTNLLDLSRIEAGVLTPDRDVYPLDDLVDEALVRLRPRVLGRHVEVAIGDVAVDVDAVFVEEALTNVLENALKYTAASTTIRISSRPIDDHHVRLTVEDAGQGVPESALPRLFDKFYRVPGRPGGSRAGTGIGLAVVRGLVEATGGAVSARRGGLGGLAIDLDLPAAVVPAELALGGG